MTLRNIRGIIIGKDKAMKKIILCFLFIALSCGLVFSQTEDENWGGIVRFDVLATVLEAFAGSVFGYPSFGIIADWVPYVTPSIGIPVEIEISILNNIYGIMGGIEAVPFRHKEKSGLYLAAMGGPYYAFQRVTFGLKAKIGYQLVTDNGFVFTPAIGVKYLIDALVELNLMIGMGFAYKKR